MTIVIHGGAGNIHPGMMTAQQEELYTQGLKAALDAGYNVLAGGGSSVDAVVAAVICLEDNVIFNAGRGSVFTKKGIHEMDAALMEGATLAAGAVTAVRNIRNPVKLAREVMENSGHVILSGAGAAEFADRQGIQRAPDEYFFNRDRYEQWIAIRDSDFTQLDHAGDNLKSALPPLEHKFGTVGAVACDAQGNLAASTSTGGMTNKRWGRIGDSPVIGAGTYANNATCAVSCTGHGELFLRGVVAYDVSCLMEYRGLSVQEAADTVIKQKLPRLGGEGGMIAVDGSGTPCFSFNSAGMYRALRTQSGREEIAFYG